MCNKQDEKIVLYILQGAAAYTRLYGIKCLLFISTVSKLLTYTNNNKELQTLTD